MTHGRTARIALIALLATAGPVAATDGPVYIQGPQRNVFVGGQVTVSEPQPNVWQINYPAVLALTGTKWEMTWACQPGTEAAYVAWNSLRYAAPSAFHAAVVGANGLEVGLVPDVELPQSPSAGREFVVGLPAGQCAAGLSLRQSQTVAQHARVFWVGNPRAAFRDVQTPSVTIRQVPSGWVNAAATTIRVEWAARDNMGADGMLVHTVSVAGVARWSGSPGEGDFGVTVPIGDLGDGHQPVAVAVAGDGTGPGSATSYLSVDRTPPVASAPTVTAVGSGTASLRWSASDATSGVAAGSVEVNSAADGSIDGSWIALETRAEHDGDGYRGTFSLDGIRDGVHAIRLRLTDVAGNTSHSPLGRIVIDRTSPDDARARELGAATLSFDVLHAVAAERDLVVGVRYGTSLSVSGALRRADGSPLAGMEIEVRDATGTVRGRGTTATDGTYRLTMTPGRGGPHRIGVAHRDALLPASAGVLDVRLAPRLTIRVSRRTTRARGPAVVFTGRIEPSPAALGLTTKQVVFEWRDPIRKIWRPMVNTRASWDGAVRARWTFAAGGYRIPVRLRLTRELGWPTIEGVSRTVTVRVK